jgi:hypothetical protein
MSTGEIKKSAFRSGRPDRPTRRRRVAARARSPVQNRARIAGRLAARTPYAPAAAVKHTAGSSRRTGCRVCRVNVHTTRTLSGPPSTGVPIAMDGGVADTAC